MWKLNLIWAESPVFNALISPVWSIIWVNQQSLNREPPSYTVVFPLPSFLLIENRSVEFSRQNVRIPISQMSARQVWFWAISGQRESSGLTSPALYLLCGKNVVVALFSWSYNFKELKKPPCMQRALPFQKRWRSFDAHPYLQFPAVHDQWLPTQQREVWLFLGPRALTPGTQGAQHLPWS